VSQRISRDANSAILLLGLFLVTAAIVKHTRSDWLVLIGIASLVGGVNAGRDQRQPSRQPEVGGLGKK